MHSKINRNFHKVFSICFVSSFYFFLQLLSISLVLLILHYLLKLCSKMPYSNSASRMLTSKIANSARNSASRIYPSLTKKTLLAGFRQAMYSCMLYVLNQSIEALLGGV